MRALLRLPVLGLTALLLTAQTSSEESEEEEDSYQEETETEEETEESEEGPSEASEESEPSPPPPPRTPPPAKTPPGAKGTPGAPTPPAPPPKPPEIGLDYQLKAWSVVNASSGAINDCLDKYLEFNPTAVGTVDMTLDISGEGRMLQVSTRSGLPGSEKLQQCLKFIGQSWKFPSAEGIVKFSTTLQVKVQKGEKFTLSKPGEKPPAKKAAPKGDSGFLGFTPTFGTGYYQ